MTTLLHLPTPLYTKVAQIAEAQNQSVEEFLVLAVAEKLATMLHQEWLHGKEPATAEGPCNDG